MMGLYAIGVTGSTCATLKRSWRARRPFRDDEGSHGASCISML